MEKNEGFQSPGTAPKSATVFLPYVYTAGTHGLWSSTDRTPPAVGVDGTMKSRRLKFCQHFPGQESWRWL